MLLQIIVILRVPDVLEVALTSALCSTLKAIPGLRWRLATNSGCLNRVATFLAHDALCDAILGWHMLVSLLRGGQETLLLDGVVVAKNDLVEQHKEQLNPSLTLD
jgi:hypothetical protein